MNALEQRFQLGVGGLQHTRAHRDVALHRGVQVLVPHRELQERVNLHDNHRAHRSARGSIRRTSVSSWEIVFAEDPPVADGLNRASTTVIMTYSNNRRNTIASSTQIPMQSCANLKEVSDDFHRAAYKGSSAPCHAIARLNALFLRYSIENGGHLWGQPASSPQKLVNGSPACIPARPTCCLMRWRCALLQTWNLMLFCTGMYGLNCWRGSTRAANRALAGTAGGFVPGRKIRWKPCCRRNSASFSVHTRRKMQPFIAHVHVSSLLLGCREFRRWPDASGLPLCPGM